MTTISLCMIVKNEENVLARCLDSAKEIADEIVVVDTGSTDRTKEIAGQFTGKVCDFPWIDDFSAARNYAFSLATQEFILWLDADDFFAERDRQSLLDLKKTLDPMVDSVTMPYHLVVDQADNPTYSIRRNRLVRRSRNFRWIGAVHEYLEVGGVIINSEIAVRHKKEKIHSDRNLQIYRRQLEAGKEFSPRDLYYYANELKDNAFLEEAALYYEKFLDCKQGWIEDNIAACQKVAECYEHLNQSDKHLQALFRTMSYDLPRAETCCQIGAFFFNACQLDQAIFWYELATNMKKPQWTLGAVDHAAWSWLPHLQLCVCHDRLGNFEKARQHNDIALSYNPMHPSMLFNKAYFDQKFSGGCPPA
jgi:glycosyltransferase involved in cell wall biosynthesis